ncbi:MAG TPA: malate synthase G [Porticoccaceae bacterium]|nr:malate synthase G [Porticoccaceae bacterium]
MKTEYIEQSGLRVSSELHDLVSRTICIDLGLDAEKIWAGFAHIVDVFMPRNNDLLVKRVTLQKLIDAWHIDNQGIFDFDNYKTYLSDIGYLIPDGDDFTVSPAAVDSEIALQAGPQLVVPIMNARFAVNAANARWGSLYDALYGNDVISDADAAEKLGAYNPLRGAKVIAYGRDFLDQAFPLTNGSHHDTRIYKIADKMLIVEQISGETARLKSPEKWVGYLGDKNKPSSILLLNNNLHVEIQVDSYNNVGASDHAHVKDIVLEAALTTIMDCEDSVVAVDSADKTLAYRNWMGLMRGTLSETVSRSTHNFERTMAADRLYLGPDEAPFELSGRALMFVRNVGHLMTTSTVLNALGNEVPEGIVDAFMSTLIGLYDLRGKSKYVNSKCGNVYIVKPKMHGPEEVAFTHDLFSAVEDLVGLARYTIKVGIMDEERRTSINLKECIRAVKERVVFINTGFLDRTGDEIHTSMLAGPFACKAELKSRKWISAYEDRNVDIGLACGMGGKGQIGKGMWAMPDNMADMMLKKIDHPNSGASTAWVPSPTAATLHAVHYHQIDVAARQVAICERTLASVDDLLDIPLLHEQTMNAKAIQRELDNNIQGMLGYVVRWVNQGIGCSKVPDIDNVGLMEDRATLRISSQHLANWLHHGVCSPEQIKATLQRMASIVDEQNMGDSEYRPMGPDFASSLAFQAASDLIFKGVEQPNGYTEPLLHEYRLRQKLQAS